MTGPTKPAMSVFEHYVAACAIAHMRAIRSAREGTPKETAALNVALFHRMHRLSALAAELGAAALFTAPARELGNDEIARLFPE